MPLYEADIDLQPILTRTVALIGYGNHGRSHALNLRDSGVEGVLVALRDGSGSRSKAEADGFEVVSLEDAARRADVLSILAADEAHKEIWETRLAPNARAGQCLMFCHGFSVDYGLVDPPEGFDLIIFLSKHAARSRNDAMCVHAVGNFGSAQLGGKDGMLVPTDPAILTALYRALKERAPRTAVGSYEVSLEAVHHGPFSEAPVIFYELGASEENWEDAEAA
ncbi:MAG: D-aminoacyl-tRNA deacylase, partial [Oceanicaulis sp.]